MLTLASLKLPSNNALFLVPPGKIFLDRELLLCTLPEAKHLSTAI